MLTLSAELLLLLLCDIVVCFSLDTDFFFPLFFDFTDVFSLDTDFFGFERFAPDMEISLSGIRIPSDSRALRALFTIECWVRGAEKAHGSKTMRKQGLRGCRIGSGLRWWRAPKEMSGHRREAGMGGDEEVGVQRRYAPKSICFGCGPANEKGLRIDSKRSEKGLELWFTPSEEHQAFPGMVNGGIIGTLLDCHGNWVAAIALMDSHGEDHPPCTVTASYSVQLRRPTPANTPLHVTGEVLELMEDRARVSMQLVADGKLCAQGEGLFVSVKEGHPAYHRWD